MSRFAPPAPPYRGPVFRHSGNGNKPIKGVVVHSTVSPCEPGGADNICAYFRSSSAGGSAHYVVDPTATRQAAFDSVDCWHAPPDTGWLGVEMCDIPGPVPGDSRGSAAWKAAKRAWRWTRKPQRQMLNRTAVLTADLLLAYECPVRFVGRTDLQRGHGGVTTHNEMSHAFNQSTHWDPGFWPRRHFMRLVQRRVKARRKAGQ